MEEQEKEVSKKGEKQSLKHAEIAEEKNGKIVEEIKDFIENNFKLNAKEKKVVDEALSGDLNFPRLFTVLETMVDYHMQDEVMVAYLLFQYSKNEPEKAEALKGQLTKAQQKLFEIFKILKDVQTLTKSGEAEDIRRMFVAICQDMRVVIIKFATILYDLKLIENPMTREQHSFVKMVSDIFAPLAERLGLSQFKNDFEDICFKLLEPKAYEELRSNALLKTEDNQKQFAITKAKLQQILDELGIKGEIQARQKHLYSVYKKLTQKNITLGKVYDLLAMRVLVEKVEDCYAVFGKIHAIYKPIAGRVKDYISSPKPNGYQSLHTTIVADNNRPLEIQIRTFDMHRASEYGVAAHWIYKEKGTKQNKFDEKLAWFRSMLEEAQSLSSEEFLETLKTDLYGESIFVQTPKGKVLEFPLGATVIDFAYAIHSEVGNHCAGGKINGKMVPITTKLSNGDVVEIVTNSSRTPSRDWLNFVKTSSARSKIRSFFKSELKDENIRTGKSVLEQAIHAKLPNISKADKEKFLLQVANGMMIETLDSLYAEVGAGSLAVASVVGRFVNLYSKEKSKTLKTDVLTVRQNKDGVLVDGDSGILVRYARCCQPVTGDEIVGYISSGRGVTIHRKGCQNLKFLEQDRLISAEWQSGEGAFLAVVRVVADNKAEVVNSLNNTAVRSTQLRGFGYKKQKDELVFEIAFEVKNKAQLEEAMKAFAAVKGVQSVVRKT